MVSVKVDGPSINLSNLKLTAKAKKYVDKRDYINFRKLCGNNYFQEVKTGAEFTAILKFTASNEQERQDLQASLDVVAQGYGSGHAKYSDSVEKIKKYSNLEVQILRKGTSEAIPHQTIEDLLKYAEEFPTKINENTAVVTDLLKADYETIVPEIPVFRDADRGMTLLSDRASDAYDELSTLQAAKAHPEQMYPVVTAAVLEAMEKNLVTYISVVEVAAADCAENPQNCFDNVKHLPPLSSFSPRPATRVDLSPKSGQEQFVGNIGMGETKTLVILGQWSAWDNGDNNIWPPDYCCFDVVKLNENGSREVKGYSPSTTNFDMDGPAKVYVKIGDSSYADNRSFSLQAVLFDTRKNRE